MDIEGILMKVWICGGDRAETISLILMCHIFGQSPRWGPPVILIMDKRSLHPLDTISLSYPFSTGLMEALARLLDRRNVSAHKTLPTH